MSTSGNGTPDGGGRQPGRDDLLLAAFLAGKSAEEAATAAGCSKRTAYRRLHDAGFRERLAVERRLVLDRTADRLSNYALAAADALHQLLASNNELVRLGAARSILDNAARVRELQTFEQRLAALEARLSQPQPYR
jgi:hypothetical protein